MAFKRAFGRGHGDLEQFAQTRWGRDLLSLWRPAGQASDDGGLRLAVRNGTLNFYRRGQSVAKVGLGADSKPHLDIHVAYVTGKRGLGQHYARLSERDLNCRTFDGPLSPYSGSDTLAGWVREADQRKGAEKAFVDDLVTHNSQIIDLEMGLSDYKSTDGKSTAPRMDLVALEADAAGALQIVFWEAKMMGNPDLRCEPSPEKQPHVVAQVEKYTTWLDQGSNRSDVISAYRDNCQLLIGLHKQAQDINPKIGKLDPMIVRAAENGRLGLDDRPRVVVRDPRVSKSWISNGHDVILSETHGIHVQLISGDPPSSYALQGRA